MVKKPVSGPEQIFPEKSQLAKLLGREIPNLNPVALALVLAAKHSTRAIKPRMLITIFTCPPRVGLPKPLPT